MGYKSTHLQNRNKRTGVENRLAVAQWAAWTGGLGLADTNYYLESGWTRPYCAAQGAGLDASRQAVMQKNAEKMCTCVTTSLC